MKIFPILVLAVMGAVCLPMRTAAQSAAPTTVTEEASDLPTREALEAKLSSYQVVLRDTREQLAAESSESSPDLGHSPRQEEAELLERIIGLVKRQMIGQELLDGELSSRARDTSVVIPSAGESDTTADAPSLLIADELSIKIRERREALESLEAQLVESRRALAEADDKLEAREAARRQARENQNFDPFKLRKLELESSEAREALLLLRFEVKIHRTRIQIATQELQPLEASFATIRGRVTFSKEELAGKLGELDKRVKEIEAQLTALQRAQKKREDQSAEWERLKQSEDSAEAQIYEARRRERALLELQHAILQAERERLAEQRRIWNRRYEASRGEVSAELLSEWYEEAQDDVRDIEKVRGLARSELDQLQREASALDLRMQSIPFEQGALLSAYKDQRQTMAKTLIMLMEAQEMLETTQFLAQRLAVQVAPNRRVVNLAEIWDQIRAFVLSAWRYELYVADDRPITVAKVIFALVLLVVGYVIAGRLTGMFARRFLERSRLTVGAIAAFKSLIFYSLLLIFTLIALNIVKIPLTVFTLFGGALAIGVGFGSQTIVSNFISGLLLLIERPVRVGDFIDVQGTRGTITHIGARGTRIRTPEGVDIIVPNSALLQNNIQNFTLGDDRIRSFVRVGVAYGSDVRKAQAILEEIGTAHEKILSTPVPYVLFTDFGDSALIFELYFWMRILSLRDKREVESSLRFDIEQRFREAGIVIAFPQRDIHLDVAAPLQIQLVRGERP